MDQTQFFGKTHSSAHTYMYTHRQGKHSMPIRHWGRHKKKILQIIPLSVAMHIHECTIAPLHVMLGPVVQN